MKKVLIVYNPDKSQAKKISLKIRNLLRRKTGLSIKTETPGSRLPKADLCIALGGDGTILKIGRKLAPSGTPILGVNLGSLGFLADFSYNDFAKFLPDILNGKYTIEKRPMLDVELKKNSSGRVFRNLAVNDCIVHVGQSLHISNFLLRINGSYITEYTGDGLIVSTPTGSTAYSLAAGGPIVYPTLSALAITPICPHTLSQRSILVSAEDMISIEMVKYKFTKTTILSVDGQDFYKLNVGDVISITKSEHSLLMVKHPTNNYFGILQNKLNWGKR